MNKFEKFYNSDYLKHEESVKDTPELLRRLITVRYFLSRHKGIKTILDAGCSAGYLTEFTDKRSIYGIDLSKELLKKVKNYKEVKQTSLTKIPYPDNYFDLVVCFQVLEHIPDYKKALKELKRVAKNYILLSTDFTTITDKTNSRDPFDNPHGHIHLFNVNKFEELIQSLDLSIQRKEYHYPLLEFSTIKRKNHFLHKVLRYFILKINTLFNYILKPIYYNILKSAYMKDKTQPNYPMENCFMRYGNIIDLETEIAYELKVSF